MKYNSILALHILFVSVCAGASTANNKLDENKQVRTVFTGSLLYADNENVSLKVWDNDNLIQPNETILTHSSKGFFKYELLLSHPRNISLVVGTTPLNGDNSIGLTGEIIVIEPGDSLHITIPSANSQISKDVSFSGKGAEKQFIVNEINSELRKLIKNWTTEPIWNIKTTISFNIACKELFQSHLNKNKNAISESVYNHLKATLMGLLHSSSIQTLEIDNIPGSESRQLYIDMFLKNFPVSDLIVSEGRVVTSNILEKRALLDYAVSMQLSYEPRYLNDVPYMYNILSQAYANTTIKSRVIAGYIVSRAKRNGWNSYLEEAFNNYLSEINVKDTYSSQMLAIKTKLESNLAMKAKAFDFALQDTIGNIVTLRQFKGKIVLLDFMYYGCSGCFYIAPVLHEIEKMLQGEDISFISISVDETLQRFKKGIGKYTSPTSIPLYTNGEGTNHDIVQHYGIIAYPTLVLIDKNGKLISSRVPDPRLKENKEMLIKLIKAHL